jgi:hypothetical protein
MRDCSRVHQQCSAGLRVNFSYLCIANFPLISGLFSTPFSALAQAFGWQFLRGFFLEVCVAYLVQ